jgi:hypothetical protein
MTTDKQSAAKRIMADKLTIWVLCPTQINPLNTYADLLTYSCLAYHNRYGKPTLGKLAWHTGLHRDTVAKSLTRLQQLELVKDMAAISRPDWFGQKGGTSGSYWTDSYQYWKYICPVDAFGGKARFAEPTAMVFSFLFHQALAGFVPKRWTAAYIAKPLRLTPKTVIKALDRLEYLTLYDKETESVIDPSEFTYAHDAYFRKRSGKATDKAIGFFAPKRPAPLLVEETQDEPATAVEQAPLKATTEATVTHHPKSFERLVLINKVKELGLPDSYTQLRIFEQLVRIGDSFKDDWQQLLQEVRDNERIAEETTGVV